MGRKRGVLEVHVTIVLERLIRDVFSANQHTRERCDMQNYMLGEIIIMSCILNLQCGTIV